MPHEDLLGEGPGVIIGVLNLGTDFFQVPFLGDLNVHPNILHFFIKRL